MTRDEIQARAYAVARKWMPDSAPDSAKLIALMCYVQIGMQELVDAALEEAAKVADEHCSEGIVCHDVGDDIRALKGK